jgi:hypothetical protein
MSLFKNITVLLVAFSLNACTNVIKLSESVKKEVAGCNITVQDGRVDKNLIDTAPGVSLSFPLDYPLEKAMKNKLCQSQLVNEYLIANIEQVKCKASLANIGVLDVFIKITLVGADAPILAFQNDYQKRPAFFTHSLIGEHCAYTLNKAFDDITSQMLKIVKKENKI